MAGVNGPLNGIKILDLTHVWAGPLGVRFLADLGAEVVKVEAPYGRGPQQFPSTPIGGWIGKADPEEPWNRNALFTKLHRNRQSFCVDLKQADGRNAFLELVRVADVVIENFSATAMRSMGLGYDALALANPQIIYVSMPGFGATGPYSERVAFGPVVEPMSGLTNMLGYGPDEPRNSALAIMDPVAAVHSAAAVVEALRQCQITGAGAYVELSLHEGGLTYSGPWLLDHQMGHTPVCMGNRHPNMAPHGIYPCLGQDQWLALACVDQMQWRALCGLIPGLAQESDLQQRQKAADDIDRKIRAWTQNQSKAQASELLQASGIAAGPVNGAADLFADTQAQFRNFFVPYEQFDTPMPGNPIHMAGLASHQWTQCPDLGANNHDVLSQWLGYGDAQISALEDAGVLFNRPPD